MTKKRYGGPTPGDRVEAYMRQFGIQVDGERLEERASAARQRAKLDEAEAIDMYRQLGAAVRKARRHCEVVEMVWRMDPNSTTLQAAKEAQAARSSLYKELLELCLQDQDLAARLSR
jgi:hypothetical protein